MPQTPSLLVALVLTLAVGSPAAVAFDTLPDANPIPNATEAKENPPVWAEIDEAAPSIKLRFLFAGDYKIYKRIYGETEWGPALVASTGVISEWTDTNVTTGVIYEYGFERLDFDNSFGAITAGIRVDQAGPRGTLILPIAENVVEGANPEIRTLIEDLVGDGWRVVPFLTPAYSSSAFQGDNQQNGIYGYDYPSRLRNRIREIYENDPGNVRMVYFLGHVPLAQSGTSVLHPDGHGSRSSYVTDFFYTDMDGRWTDQASARQGYASPANVPGDGIFDPNTMPSELELAFGRVDPFNKGSSVNSVLGEEHHLSLAKYLRKAHAYRHVQPFGLEGAEALAGRRAIVRDGGGGQQGAISMASEFLQMFGPELVDDYHTNTNDSEFLQNNGPYLFYGQDSQGATGTGDGEKGVHRWGMQSYWGDWFANDRSRKDLFSDTNMTLTWFYAGRWDDQWQLFPLGIGETFGEAARLSANFEREEYITGAITVANYWERNEFLRNLVGDPALRLFPVPPASNLSATPSGGSVNLTWDPPSELAEFVEYRIYRSNDILGSFTEIASGLTETGYTDAAPPSGPKTYMVQAVHLVGSGSGSFFTNSQGVFASVGLAIDPYLIPAFPVGVDANFQLTASGANGDPAWSLAGGNLPAGMALAADGSITGNPVLPGEYAVTVEVVDDDGVPVQRDFSILVAGALSEVLDMDLRSENGLGLADNSQMNHSVTTWGDPQLTPEGMVFDGEGDAIQVHRIGHGSSISGRNFLPDARDDFTIAFSFKADPASQGGVFVSKAVNLSGGWDSSRCNYAVWMRNDGRLVGQMASRQSTSSASYNDGRWHHVVMTGGVDFYVDGVRIGGVGPASKAVSLDMLIGARWDDEEGTTIADVFDGTIRDFKIFDTNLSESEVVALYQRKAGTRPDISPNPPIISGLPETFGTDEAADPAAMGIPFNATDPDGEPLRFEVLPEDPDDFLFFDVIQGRDGYELRFDTDYSFVGRTSLTVAVYDDWPGHTAVHTIEILTPGPVDDQYNLNPEASVLDVLANDAAGAGALILSEIVSQPSGGYARIENNQVVFHPPTHWSSPVTFTYRVAGSSNTATVTVTPSNVPTPSPDNVEVSGHDPVLLDVLANDTDPLGEDLTIVIVNQPILGTTRLVDGKVEYTPPAGNNSPSDTFSYRVENETGFSQTTGVSVSLADFTGSVPLVDLGFDEGTGASAGNNGTLGATGDATLGGTTAWVDSIDGKALTFDGATTGADLGNPAELDFDPATDSFTLLFILDTPGTLGFPGSRHTLISKDNDAGENQYTVFLGHPDGSTRTWTYAGVTVGLGATQFDTLDAPPASDTSTERASSWSSLPNQWTQVVVINNAETRELRVYVNNWLVAVIDTSAEDIAAAGNGAPVRIGARPDGSGGLKDFLAADVDRVKIWSRALDPLEIKGTMDVAGIAPSNLAPVGIPPLMDPSEASTLEPNVEVVLTPVYEDPDTDESNLDFIWYVYAPGFAEFFTATTPTYTLNPNQSGDWWVYCRISQEDGAGESFTFPYFVYTVGNPPNVIRPVRFSTGRNLGTIPSDAPADIQLTVSGGTPPYTYEVLSGALPPGMVLGTTDGTLTGSSTATGNHSFRILATDSGGDRAIRLFRLFIAPADTNGNGIPDDWEQDVLGGLDHAAGDDANRNGLPTVLEYLLGNDGSARPVLAIRVDRTRGPPVNGDDHYYTIRLRHRGDLFGHTLSLLSSNNLEDWDPVTHEATVVADDGVHQTVEFRIPRGGGNHLFFLIKVN